MEPHQLTISQLIATYATNVSQGLSDQQAVERLALYGPNELPHGKSRSWFVVFLRQFTNPLVYILIAVATSIFFAGPEKTDAFIIMGVLFFNAIIGTIQEGRTQDILETLKHFVTSRCIVIRNGNRELVQDNQLVIGDIMVLQEGQKVPADARIIESYSLTIDEAVLTGQSSPVHKSTELIHDESLLADRTNMVYKGTYILAGSGKALVVATGAQTEVGNMHRFIKELETDLPLKKEIDRLSYWILIGFFVLCVTLLAIGFMTDKPFNELMVMLTALFICVVPEGLPLVLRLVLAPGAYHMAKQHVLAKRMQAVITLGRTDVILVDKIGPLPFDINSVVQQARSNGIKVVLVTGDHEATATHTVGQAGILQPSDMVLHGSQLPFLSDEELVRIINSITVYSHVKPEDRLRIIKTFQRLGKIVAVTGDSNKDVPSLVTANLGIAMGTRGTEVAKQAADLILLDDSFVNIMYGVAWGRHIFYALRRVLLYFLITNLGAVFIVMFVLLANFPLPITAAQMLWLNLVTDGFLTISLAMEPKEEGLLIKDRLDRKMRLIDGNLLWKALFLSLPMGVGSLWIFSEYYIDDIAHARTMSLIAMAMYQWFNAWNCRSERRSLISLGLFSNRWLLLTGLTVLLLQCTLVYAPFMHAIFKTVPLTAKDWLLITLVTIPIVLIEEVRKWIAGLRVIKE